MARSTAASRSSGATRRAFPRLAMILALALAATVVGASTTLAAKPAPLSGDIELAGSSARTLGPTAMQYGGSASFMTSVSGNMAPKGYVYVRVVCSQDDWVVYQWSSRDVDFEFPLVDQAGDNLDWDGDAADCVGQLIYRVDGKRKTVIQLLDNTEFGVAGA